MEDSLFLSCLMSSLFTDEDIRRGPAGRLLEYDGAIARMPRRADMASLRVMEHVTNASSLSSLSSFLVFCLSSFGLSSFGLSSFLTFRTFLSFSGMTYQCRRSAALSPFRSWSFVSYGDIPTFLVPFEYQHRSRLPSVGGPCAHGTRTQVVPFKAEDGSMAASQPCLRKPLPVP